MRDYLNQITETSNAANKFSQDYPIDEKPLSVSEYEYGLLVKEEDFFGEDEVNDVYGSTKDNTFIEGYKAGSQIEVIDVSRILTLSNSLSDEVKLLQDLQDDISSGGFNVPNSTTSYRKLLAIYSLKKAIEDINQNSSKLYNRVNRTIKDLDKLNTTSYEQAQNIRDHIQIPLAIAMQQVPNFKNNTFVVQSLKNQSFGIKSDYEGPRNTLNGLFQAFIDGTPEDREYAIRYILNYDQTQWNELPQENKTELITSFTNFAIVSVALLDTGTSGLDHILISGGYLYENFKLPELSTNRLMMKTDYQQFLDTMAKSRTDLGRRIEELKRKRLSNLPKCFNIQGFHTLDDCEFNIDDPQYADLLKELEHKITTASIIKRNLTEVAQAKALLPKARISIDNFKNYDTDIKNKYFLYKKEIYENAELVVKANMGLAYGASVPAIEQANYEAKLTETKDILNKLEISKMSKFMKIDNSNENSHFFEEWKLNNDGNISKISDSWLIPSDETLPWKGGLKISDNLTLCPDFGVDKYDIYNTDLLGAEKMLGKSSSSNDTSNAAKHFKMNFASNDIWLGDLAKILPKDQSLYFDPAFNQGKTKFYINDYKDVRKALNKLTFVFHHSENLKTMLLTQAFVHFTVQHTGGDSIAKKLRQAAVKISPIDQVKQDNVFEQLKVWYFNKFLIL